MHDSVLAFARRVLRPEEIVGRRVLEIGSYNVNGSIRQVVEPMLPDLYVGLDAMAGPGVDVVMDVSRAVWHFGPSQFDVVLCCEMLEHCARWPIAIEVIKRLLAPRGLAILTTRGPGFPYHYPPDYWRFIPDQVAAMFADWQVLDLEKDMQAGHPGVLCKARKPSGWQWTPLPNLDVMRVRQP